MSSTDQEQAKARRRRTEFKRNTVRYDNKVDNGDKVRRRKSDLRRIVAQGDALTRDAKPTY